MSVLGRNRHSLSGKLVFLRSIQPPPDLAKSRILIVDDEEGVAGPLQRLLLRAGYQDVTVCLSSLDASDEFRNHRPDMVILDVHMPIQDGFSVMAELFPEIDPDDHVPIVMITGDTNPEIQQRALSLGVTDFLNKPFESVTVLLRLKNLLEAQRVHRELRASRDSLEQRVAGRTRDLAQAQIEILRRLALAAEYRDDVTGHHAERVGVLSALIADALGLGPETVRLIRRAAPLHDVGKIGIPDAILMKPGPLTSAEFGVMKTHTTMGARILSGSRFPLLQEAQTIALSHHERWEGAGYPHGIRGEEIPLPGRIVAVADVFDSLCHERPYKPARPVETAIEVVTAGSGNHFDPEVVAAFLQVAGSGTLVDVERLITSVHEFGLPGWDDVGEAVEMASVVEEARAASATMRDVLELGR